MVPKGPKGLAAARGNLSSLRYESTSSIAYLPMTKSLNWILLHKNVPLLILGPNYCMFIMVSCQKNSQIPNLSGTYFGKK